jgi:glycine C-acetyltransferase
MFNFKRKTKTYFDREIEALKEKGLYNEIPIIESPIQTNIKVNGKKQLNFCSNNYLGLANDKRLKKAAKHAIDKYGVGPAAVRSIAGTQKIHKELEERLAKFKKVDEVITLQGGFLANLATIPAIVGKEDIIFSDELNHASIIDACRLSGATVVRYVHADPKDLEQKLNEYIKYERKLIVTDGEFSMDGDIAPLPILQQLAEKYKAILMVDDAHGEGVLGSHGRGVVDHFHLHGKVDIEVGTLSKAFGVIGGYVAGRRDIIEWLRQRARPFLFSSAATPGDVGACIEAVKILEKSSELVDVLWSNADYLKSGLRRIGFDIGKSETPIIPVMLGEVKIAKEFSRELYKEGVFVKALGYPTVPMGAARIRVMNSAAHKKEDLEKALSAFSKVGKNLKII